MKRSREFRKEKKIEIKTEKKSLKRMKMRSEKRWNGNKKLNWWKIKQKYEKGERKFKGRRNRESIKVFRRMVWKKKEEGWWDRWEGEKSKRKKEKIKKLRQSEGNKIRKKKGKKR